MLGEREARGKSIHSVKKTLDPEICRLSARQSRGGDVLDRGRAHLLHRHGELGAQDSSTRSTPS